MTSVLDLSPGATFAGDFRVVRPLAKGGMGAVYVALQVSTERERALKLMHPTLVSDARSRERFEREARVASRIESDHVVEVIAAGVDAGTGTPWLVMELLKGETLAERLERGPLSPSELRSVVVELGHALSAAHRAGIVHRDLKPENVFLTAPRRPGVPFTLKVLDFGVAALVHESSGKSTATQGVGSPMWMAPEQTNVGAVQPATDVWALGLLAFHLLTGRVYWRAAATEGSTITALLCEIMVDALAPASERARELGVGERIPPGFDAWFARALARDPAARFAEAGAATEALLRVLDGVASIVPATTPQAFAATAAIATGPMAAGATGASLSELAGSTASDASRPAAQSGGALPAPSTRPLGGASGPVAGPVAPSPASVAASPPRRWPWILGAVTVVSLGCVGSATAIAWRLLGLAEEVGAASSAEGGHLVVTGDDGARVEIGPGGLVVVPPDAAAIVIATSAADAGSTARAGTPAVAATTTDEPTGAAIAVATTGAPAETEPAAPGGAVARPASHDDDEAPARPRSSRGGTGSGGGGGHDSTTDLARRFRSMVLNRCVEGNIADEPRARWTFTLLFSDTSGRASSVRITGPHAGEEGRYTTFRRCVVWGVAGFDAGGDEGPFSFTLP